jgi:hypothetical protein
MEKKMVKMKEKILTLLTFVFIAMSISGFTYAHWGNAITIEGTAEIGCLCIVFKEVIPAYDNDDDTTVFPFKDVGEVETWLNNEEICECTGTTGMTTMVIQITNAYPCYEAYCGFIITNIGTIPGKIIEITISCDPAITIDIVDLTLEQTIEPDGETEARIDLHVEQAAEECHTYEFTISIIATEVD